MFNLINTFRNRENGTVLVASAVILSVLSAVSFFAVDYASVAQQKVALQRAVDRAALTTVRSLEFVRAGAVASNSSTADDESDSALTTIADAVIRNALGDSDPALTTNVDQSDTDSVRVIAALDVKTPFGDLSVLNGKTITAEAEAQLYSARNICMMALGNSEVVGINLEHLAQIKAGDCGMYSNSIAVSSVNTIDSSYIDSSFVCAAGGYTGGTSNVSSPVMTDCPQVTDPLVTRPLEDTPAACDHNYAVFKNNDTATLDPGHYCGGLVIEGNANIQMNPGTYHISGGMLLVQHTATLYGEGVAIIMEDAMGSIYFNNDASITLAAPTTGLMAGIVIASRPVCGGTDCHYRVFEIKSAQVSSLLGTIYVPEDRFIINSTMPISEEAAFTIILAKYVQGQGSPTLVLNTDYEATDVPVPTGFVGSEGSRLIR